MEGGRERGFAPPNTMCIANRTEGGGGGGGEKKRTTARFIITKSAKQNRRGETKRFRPRTTTHRGFWGWRALLIPPGDSGEPPPTPGITDAIIRQRWLVNFQGGARGGAPFFSPFGATNEKCDKNTPPPPKNNTALEKKKYKGCPLNEIR